MLQPCEHGLELSKVSGSWGSVQCMCSHCNPSRRNAPTEMLGAWLAAWLALATTPPGLATTMYRPYRYTQYPHSYSRSHRR